MVFSFGLNFNITLKLNILISGRLFWLTEIPIQVSESDSYGSKDQMFPVNPNPLLNSSEAPTTDSPQLQLKSYKKKGYSVAISNGSLYECTSEKGVVMMENGTTFSIAITNSNDYGEKRKILLQVDLITLPDKHVQLTFIVYLADL